MIPLRGNSSAADFLTACRDEVIRAHNETLWDDSIIGSEMALGAMRNDLLTWLETQLLLLPQAANTFGPVEASGSVVENTGGGK